MTTTDDTTDTHDQSTDHAPASQSWTPSSWTMRAALWWDDLIEDVDERLTHRADLHRLTGLRVEDIPPAQHTHWTDWREMLRRSALRTATPATIATATAVTVFAATAVVTAQAAATWHPWATVQHVVGPITSTDPTLSRLLDWAATSPALALVAWIAGYAVWLGTAHAIAESAQRGRYAGLSRLGLAAATLTGTWITYHQIDRIAGPGAAFLAVGVVLSTWRALAIATARHARTVARLNRDNARALLATRRAAENAAADLD